MTRTIYRGYDITSQKQGAWTVHDPKNPGKALKPGPALIVVESEEAAMAFVDKHRRAAAQERSTP